MNLSRTLAEQYVRDRTAMAAEDLYIMDSALAQLRLQIASRRRVIVGDLISDFAFSHIRGGRISLSRLVERGPAVLSFFRGGWCPYCKLELNSLKQAVGDINQLGATLVLISPETADWSLTTCRLNNLDDESLQEVGLEIVTDPGNRVARRLGLVYKLPDSLRRLYLRIGADLVQQNGQESWELPIPATLIVDRDRRVKLAFADIDYTKRLEPGVILNKLRQLDHAC